MGFSRHEYWSRLPFPSPGIELTALSSPALAGEFFTTVPMWDAHDAGGKSPHSFYLFMYLFFPHSF